EGSQHQKRNGYRHRLLSSVCSAIGGQPDVSSFWEDRLRDFQHGAAHPGRPADWLYPLAHPWSDFFAGTCCGDQTLVGPYGPSLVACFFSPAGDLLRVEERPWSQAQRTP